MILTKLEVSSFRNVVNLSLEPHPRLNLITGDNGAGKSSILEAIQCLSTGHSFRTRKARELISRQSQSFTLTALFKDPNTAREHRCGLQRMRDGSVELRLDFEEVGSMSGVTRLLPVKALTPDSHKLIQEGPHERRQFLDWGVFHMEHSFFDIWKQFKRSLSQRNQLLRDSGSINELRTWDGLFVESAEQLNKLRAVYVEQLAIALQKRMTDINARFHVELQYRSGWSDEHKLADLLIRNLDYHRRMKTTTDGPHRAELSLLVDGVPAKQVLSRGQQKVLVYLLHLSQLDLLANINARQAVVLCDDLTSELDKEHSTELIRQLLDLDGQVFVSAVDLEVLRDYEHTEFRIEHGGLKK
ncbi:DNA replication/repair protein RecF [Granulosicoccus antarcticus]|uniref:DNA replication and repair protein RecF n=1 Tax=Granulosicoccus antarcticus IMCC3135 TaxID=1192854 RepID=A0A2Z2NSI6_9GAMM|nr:DNA replication/repair protein RecF [Granulosicoccus antarcticus]ASJ70134.1 DNA replication and repair protein RecF [Granulosicoccus antarcticus IMCC3135]